jgi:hypothetical protein
LCFANERNIWLDVGYQLPPLSYHATTTKNWGINFGRHIPLKEYCLVCRFQSEINHTMTTGCAEGVVGVYKSTQQAELGMLPFLPTAAAALVLADMAKLSRKDFPLSDNFVQFSFRAANTSFLHYHRPPEHCFVCRNYDAGIYPASIKEIRFWHFS